MNKNDLIDAMSEAADISKSAANAALDAFTGSIVKTLKAGDKVAIVGFGSFETSNRSARTGRNPQTGQPMQIPAAVVAKFKPGKGLRDAVNKDAE